MGPPSYVELGYQFLLSDSALSCVVKAALENIYPKIKGHYLVIEFVSIYALFVKKILHSPGEGAVLQKPVLPNKPVGL